MGKKLRTIRLLFFRRYLSRLCPVDQNLARYEKEDCRHGQYDADDRCTGEKEPGGYTEHHDRDADDTRHQRQSIL